MRWLAVMAGAALIAAGFSFAFAISPSNEHVVCASATATASVPDRTFTGPAHLLERDGAQVYTEPGDEVLAPGAQDVEEASHCETFTDETVTVTTTVPPPPPPPPPVPPPPPPPPPPVPPPPPPPPNQFYVSPSGNNSNGTSWANAWTSLVNVAWASLPSGATVNVDGGTSRCAISPYDFSGGANDPGVTCGRSYGPFTIGASNVSIVRSTEAGRDGTVVINGGRTTILPYCRQTTYSAPAGSTNAIDFNGKSNVVIDGRARSGIVVRGSQWGVRMSSGSGNTLRNLELFDNGLATNHSWGYSTDGANVRIGGLNNVYDRLLNHDGGQDEFHSDGSGFDQSGSTVKNSWMGAMRAHPTYNYEPFNDLQGSGNDPGCTHADGFQSFAPTGTHSGLTFDYDVFGPGINQGLYPGDGGTNPVTKFNNVTVSNTLFLGAVSHNIINDSPVHGWNVSNVTLFAPQGGFELPSDGTNTITNVIKQGGYVYSPGGTWTASGNDWWLGDAVLWPSSHVNPGFQSAPSGTNPSLATLRAANLTPTISGGSPLHSFADILARIDSLN